MSFDLADILQRDSTRPAFAGERPMPRSEFFTRVFAIAAALRAAHAERPAATRVLVTCRRRAAFAAAVFGTWQAHLSVELAPDTDPSTVRRLSADADVLATLHDGDGASEWHIDNFVHNTPNEALRIVAGDAPLVQLHTSGSTAAPRRFVKTARALLGEVEALQQAFGDAPSTFLATVPPHHLYGLLFGILLPLRRGAILVDEPTLFPDDVLSALTTFDVSVLVSTPTHLRALTALPRPWPRALVVLTSGAQLPPELHASLTRDYGWIVHDVFGSTETGGVATRSEPGARWRPLPGVAVHTTEPDGSMQIDSAWSSVPAADDRIRVAEDGTFEHLGRVGSVVKVGGKRVDVDAVEAALRRIPDVTDAAVLVVDDALRGSRLIAFVAGLPATAAADVRAELASEFDAVLVPRRIVLGELPREPNGKLRRERLLALLQRHDERHLVITLAASAAFFRGHFGEGPVYPGAATLADLAAAARAAWPDLGRIERLQRIRFQKPLGPGATLRVVLRRSGASVQFEVHLAAEPADATPAVTGRLEFARFSRR